MFSDMTVPTTPQHIVDKWAKKPLDFEPGTRWQYSNTGYVVAGMIVEKVAGEPLLTFLNQRIFNPLGMRPLDQDNTNTPAFPAGYHRFALGAVRVAQPPARGWLYAAGELSMTAADLAKWDIARMNRSLIPARDWVEQETPVLRTDGRTNGYGLGVYNSYARERHVINHGGEAVGFLTQNTVYPDTRDAIIVFTNSDFSGATGTLTSGIEKIVLELTRARAHQRERPSRGRSRRLRGSGGRSDRPLQVHQQSELLFRPDDARRLSRQPCAAGHASVDHRQRPASPSRRVRQPQLHDPLFEREGSHPRHLRRTRRGRALGTVHDHAGVMWPEA